MNENLKKGLIGYLIIAFIITVASLTTKYIQFDYYNLYLIWIVVSVTSFALFIESTFVIVEK